ncbi:YciI family protein [Bosea sp. (in: a-proteobacteria)]|uniref:YciI family protein n=1 Tax=Bosea sp. (in: a-proteobacteria) TaxID=1871050 RepID=UPI002FC82B2C
MRFMVLVKATKDSEAGAQPTQELLEAMMAYNEELAKAGIMKGGDGLQPSAKGARVQFDGEKRAVVDGPFAETKELVAGYWLWECKSLDEAIAWVKRCPNPMPGPSEIEIRPLYDLADFGEIVTPEVVATWDRLKTEIGDKS